MTADTNPRNLAMFDQRQTPPCAAHEQRIALTENSVAGMGRTMEAVSTKLDLILAQITKVAILEEKHSNLIIDNDRAHKKIADQESKLDVLSVETRRFISYSEGRDKVLWALAGGIMLLAIKVLFFTAAQGMTP